MFVCLSVSPLVYLKNRISKFYDVFCTCYDVTCGVAGSAAPPLTTVEFVYYVLPVLWAASCFQHKVACGPESKTALTQEHNVALGMSWW